MPLPLLPQLCGIITEPVAGTTLEGFVPFIIVLDVPDDATADLDWSVPMTMRVIDVHTVKVTGAGGAANTAQLKNTAAPITDAMDLNVADDVVTRAGTIDDAAWKLPRGGILRVTRTKAGGNAACKVVCLCVGA